MKEIIHIAYTIIPEIIQESKIDALLVEKISGEQARRILSYKSPKDRCARLAGRLLLQKLLQQNQLPFHLSQMVVVPGNKPFIHHSFDFNIAHSGNMVVCALIKGGRIGIDIEEIRSLDVPLLEAIFTENELKLIANHPGDVSLPIQIWVRKEAIQKATGKGVLLAHAMIDTTLSFFDFERERYYNNDVRLCDGYTCTIATLESGHTFNIQYISLSELFQNLSSYQINKGSSQNGET